MTFFDGGQPDVTIGELWETQRRTMSSIGDIESIVNRLKNGQGFYGDAIQSTNYVAGVSGWKINFDGTVEFSSGTFRGAVAVGASPRVELQSVSGVGTIRFPSDNVAEVNVPSLSAAANGDVTFDNGSWSGTAFSSGSLLFSRSQSLTRLRLASLLASLTYEMNLAGGYPSQTITTKYGSADVARMSAYMDASYNGIVTLQSKDSSFGLDRARVYLDNTQLLVDKYASSALSPTLRSQLWMTDTLALLRNIKGFGAGPNEQVRVALQNWTTFDASYFDSASNRRRYIELGPTYTQLRTIDAAQAGAQIINQGTAATPWQNSTLILHSEANPGFASLAAYAPLGAGGGIAPIWGAFNNSGEVWQALNNPNTGHIPIWASAFTIMSASETKQDIEDARVDSLLRRASRIKLRRFRAATRPQTTFADGRSQDHDCAVHECGGTADNPCIMGRNDGFRFGVLSEELAELIPELTPEHAEGSTLRGVDVAQAATTALALIGRLHERVTALEQETR